MNIALEYSTRVVQEGGRRCKKSTLNDLVHLTPLRIPLMNPPRSMEVRKVQVAISGHISWGGAGMGKVLYGVRVAVTTANVETAFANTYALCAASVPIHRRGFSLILLLTQWARFLF
jgi:hypothetical protein